MLMTFRLLTAVRNSAACQSVRLRWLLSGSFFVLLSIALMLHATPSVAATTLFTWSNAAPSPIERFESQGLMVDGKLFVFGGFFNDSIQATPRADVYDSNANSWMRIADMPEALTHAGQAADGATIYIVGGYVGDSPGLATQHVWKYDTYTNVWSAGPDLPAPRGAGALVRIDRALHFFGGATRGKDTDTTLDHDDHFVLALDGGTAWTTSAALPNPRNHLAGVALNGKAYAIGGQYRNLEGTENQREVDVYDPATDAWTQVADLPVARSHISSSSFVMNNRIIVIGGSANNGKDGSSSAEVTLYDPQANVWVALPPLPAGRKTPVAGLIGTRIVVTTGNQGAPTATTWVGTLRDTWETAADAPIALGEVAGGIIGNKLYLVGEGNAATLVYDLSKTTWERPASLSQRPLVGNHHAAEVVDGKLYLFGGLGSGAGKVQIYNPITNLWTLGTDMPFAAGSSASALINGEVYVAGGISGAETTNLVAKYNVRTQVWTLLAPMSQARNHAAAGTDGTKLYLFGGRGPGSGNGNSVANGFDTVQVYDPATNTWVSSLDAGSTLAPLSQARGGMGKAVYANSEFYIIGGETLNGAGATANNVYDRVDIYSPRTNSWRQGTTMPTARHGIFPLAIADRIYVAAGGVQAGGSRSVVVEVYNVGALVPPSATPTTTATAGTYQVYLPLITNGGTSAGDQPTAVTPTPTRATTPEPTSTAPTPIATATQGTPTTAPAPTATATAVPSTPTAAPATTPTPTATATVTPGTPNTITTIDWSSIAPQPKANSEGQRAVVGGKLYSFGGFAPCCTPTRRAFVYNPATNVWTQLADMPKGVTHAGMTTDGTNIYYAGGYIEGNSGTGQSFGTKQVWRYNVGTDTYTPMPDLPVDSAAGVLAFVEGDLHYIGGTNKARTLDVGDHYVLSLEGGTKWTTAAPLPNPRHHMGSAVLGGQIYIIGGQHGHDGPLVPQSDVHRYDPISKTWTQLASIPLARNHITNATVVYGDRILIFGGQVKHNVPVDNVDVYDPVTNTWAALTPLPMPRHSAVAGVIDGVFYFSTGGTTLSYKGVPGWGTNNARATTRSFSYRLNDPVSLFICR